MCQHVNYCISMGEFPNELKHANVIPVYKKKNKINKCEKLNIGQLEYFQIF